MFERFTDRARHAVVEAQNVSKEMGHNYIGTEHLLLGALRDPDSEATKLLYALGVSYDVVALHLADYFNGVAIQATPPAHVPFTPRAKKALEVALREAAWHVEQTDKGLLWRAPQGSGLADTTTEPDASAPLRLMLKLLGPLAPDHLL